MNRDERLQVLREAALNYATAVDLARMIDDLAPRGLNDSTFTFDFKQAFLSIPFSVIFTARGWTGFGRSELNDEEFNALLEPYLRSFRESAEEEA